MTSVADTHAGVEGLGVLARLCTNFYNCPSARADALFELCDAALCADGPVKTLVGLALAPEHRRGHGALYDALNRGRIEVTRLRATLARLPLPHAVDGRLVVGVDLTRGCARTRRPARTARSATPTGAARTSTG